MQELNHQRPNDFPRHARSLAPRPAFWYAALMAKSPSKPRKSRKPESRTDRLIETALATGAPTLEVLANYEHDPLAALIRFVKGDDRIEQDATAVMVIELLDRLIDKAPEVAPQCSLLKTKVQSNWLYPVVRRERNKVNLALLEYQKARLKPVDATGDATDKSEHVITVRFENAPV